MWWKLFVTTPLQKRTAHQAILLIRPDPPDVTPDTQVIASLKKELEKAILSDKEAAKSSMFDHVWMINSLMNMVIVFLYEMGFG